MAVDPPVLWLDPLLPPHAAEADELAGWQVIRPPADGDPLADIELADAAVVGDRFPGNRETFSRAARLKVVARRGSGYDNIDIEAATECGICVTNTPDAHAISVSEYTVAVILGVLRRIVEGGQQLAAGGWAPNELVGSDLAGETVGVVGLGRIGRRVARLLRAFEAEVLGYDPFLSADARAALDYLGVRVTSSLEELLPAVRVVTIHVPFDAATRRLIGAAELARLAPGAVLVNASRGPVVDEAAVVEALRSGRLAGAALDVWDPEPPDPANPLLSMANVIATPHLAARTRQSMTRSRRGAVENAAAVLAGRRPHGLVNPRVWERRRR